MNHKSKLLTTLLTAALLIQTMPIHALAEDATDTYHNEHAVSMEDASAILDESASEDHNHDADVAESAPVGICVTAVEWQSLTDGTGGSLLGADAVMTANHARITIQLDGTPGMVDVTVDGQTVSANVSGNTVSLQVELINGAHTLAITTDNGTTTETTTASFVVDGADTHYPTLGVDAPQGMTVGQSQLLTVTGYDMADVVSVTVQISLNQGMTVEDVTIADGVVGMYTWVKGSLKLLLEVSDPSAIADGVLATVTVRASSDAEAGQPIGWTASPAIVTMKNADTLTEDFIGRFQPTDTNITLSAAYTVAGIGEAVLGAPHTLVVTDAADAPVNGISVYAISGREHILLGKTDGNGCLTTSHFTAKGAYEVYAEDVDGSASFCHTVLNYEPVGMEDGAPYAILSKGITDGKSISWMSHILGSADTALLELSTSPDMAEAVTLAGVSSVATYASSYSINRTHTVALNGLTAGTVYYYRVGDGEVWSSVGSFTVKAAGETTNMVVFGDRTNADADTMAQIAEAIRNSGISYDFAIQTGALVSDPNDYGAWEQYFSTLGSTTLDSLNTIYTTELVTDEANVESLYFGDGSNFSTYLYGDVYVAVVHYTDDHDTLRQMLEDIVWDVNVKNPTWRILSLRPTPYASDSTHADALVSEMVPTIAENGGFQLVLTANGFDYTRTEPIRDGVVTDKNGVTYINCGAVGSASALASAFDFAATVGDCHTLYLSITTTADTLTLEVYNAQSDGTSVLVDTWSIQPYTCPEDEHLYRMIVSGNNLLSYFVCDICGERKNIGEIDEITGPMMLGNMVLFVKDGEFVKEGWATHNGKVYYLRESLAVNGTQTIDGATYVFDNHVLVEGAWVEDGSARRLLWGGVMLKNTWHTQGGKTYYFLAEGSAAVGEIVIDGVTYHFDDTGALIA